MQSMTELKQRALGRYLAANGLNPQQQDAVRTVHGPVCVLAGAGSGKTTAIVSRIAFMMRFGDAYYGAVPPPADPEDAEFLRAYAAGEIPADDAAGQRLAKILAFAPVPGWRILAITFTNKAAGELKSRLMGMLGDSGEEVWASTFHSACAKILRRNIDRLGYRNDFTIYDADDAQRVVKQCLDDPGIRSGIGAQIERLFPPKSVAFEISHAKDKLLTPADLLNDADGDFRKTKTAQIYELYQKTLKEANALDFDDIIMLTVQLFETCPDVLQTYQNRCRYLLVDEYQDTNPAQFRLIELLAQQHRNLCVVGDDDQSIYKFRGATIENILSFDKQFPDSKIIRLEQNYRSTKMILAAANSVIVKNRGRKPKTLWTEAGQGEPVCWFKGQDQNEEAQYVALTIAEGVKNGGQYSDYAVLYRTHALSNTLERYFAQAGIPYRVYGGMRFFDRKEVKDVLAYLCVLENPSDALRFVRIINEPKRGIGTQTVQNILNISLDLGITPVDVLKTADSYPILARTLKPLQDAAEMFTALEQDMQNLPLDELYEKVLTRTGYLEMLKAPGEENENRLESIKELRSSIRTYMNKAENEGEEPTLGGFLEEIQLYTEQDRADESESAVTMMTVHAAKGLEYNEVFVVGLEDGIFPGRRSIGNSAEIEEERRLAYVAITRARRKLYVTTTGYRLLYGQTTANSPSRFLLDIDKTAIKQTGRFQRSGRSTAASPAAVPVRQAPAKPAPVEPMEFSIGERVKHPMFGEGTILKVTELSGDAMLEIAFDTQGTKKIMAKYARIRKVTS